MATPIKINPRQAFKKDSFWLVLAIADVTAPDDTEINDVTGIYATCYLRQDQGGAERTTNKVTLAAGLCDDDQYEALAPSTISHPDLVGKFDPQAAAVDDEKLLFEFLRDGFDGFLVRRQNVTNDTDDQVTAGEFVDVFPVSISDSWPSKDATGPEGIYQFMCGVAVTGAPGINVAVQAGV